MIRQLLKLLASGKVSRSEYDIVYKWYEEKRKDCQELRAQNDNLMQQVNLMSAELETYQATHAVLVDENTRLSQYNAQVRAVYEVHPPLIVSNHSNRKVIVQYSQNGLPQVELIQPYMKYALDQSERVEIVIEEEPQHQTGEEVVQAVKANKRSGTKKKANQEKKDIQEFNEHMDFLGSWVPGMKDNT